jgi:hypothetical protein
MATRTVIELIDDLDGSEATETVRFGLDGTDYEIDLAGQNAEELRGALARFVEAARRESGAGRRGTAAPKRAGAGPDTKAIRAWAAENGIQVNTRGRISDDVVQRYLASMS